MLRTRRTRTLSIGTGRVTLEGSGTVRIDWSEPSGYYGGVLIDDSGYSETHAVGFSIPTVDWDEVDEDDDDYDDYDD